MCREEDEKHTKQNDIRIFEKKNVKQKSTRRPKIPTVHLFWDGATWWTGDSHWPFILKSTQFFVFFFQIKNRQKRKEKKETFDTSTLEEKKNAIDRVITSIRWRCQIVAAKMQKEKKNSLKRR
jgi:predicted acyl esterase